MINKIQLIKSLQQEIIKENAVKLELEKKISNTKLEDVKTKLTQELNELIEVIANKEKQIDDLISLFVRIKEEQTDENGNSIINYITIELPTDEDKKQIGKDLQNNLTKIEEIQKEITKLQLRLEVLQSNFAVYSNRIKVNELFLLVNNNIELNKLQVLSLQDLSDEVEEINLVNYNKENLKLFTEYGTDKLTNKIVKFNELNIPQQRTNISASEKTRASKIEFTYNNEKLLASSVGNMYIQLYKKEFNKDFKESGQGKLKRDLEKSGKTNEFEINGKRVTFKILS